MCNIITVCDCVYCLFSCNLYIYSMVGSQTSEPKLT